MASDVLPGSMTPRALDHEGHLERLLVHPPLVKPAVLAEVEALVRGVHHERILVEPGFFEVIENPPDGAVHSRHAPQVILDVGLVLPVLQLLPCRVSFGVQNWP